MLERVLEVDIQFLDVLGTAVGKGGLGEVPHAFVGVELGRVGWQRDQVEPSERTTQLTHGDSAVDGSVVPDDDHMTPEVAQQVTKELTHREPVDVGAVEAVVQAHAVAPGADGESRDDGDAVAAIAMTHDRGATPRCPGPEQHGDQLEAALVGEDDVGPQPRGVFFTSGHTSRFHRPIASSSRSMARRSGFWQLQPSERMRRPT